MPVYNYTLTSRINSVVAVKNDSAWCVDEAVNRALDWFKTFAAIDNELFKEIPLSLTVSEGRAFDDLLPKFILFYIDNVLTRG